MNSSIRKTRILRWTLSVFILVIPKTAAAEPGTLSAEDVPGTPILISPQGAVIFRAPTFIWTDEDGATDYYLWVNGPSGAPVLQIWYPASSLCAGGICAGTSPLMLALGPHAWWIQAQNASGLSPWSARMDFVVANESRLIAPQGNGISPIPTFVWTAVAGTTDYYLWVQGPAGVPVIQTWLQDEAVCTGGTCSATSPKRLGAGAHTWWIWENAAGVDPWRAGMNFVVADLPAPTLISPNGRTLSKTPTYVSSAVANATDYYLWVNGPSGAVIQTAYPAASVCGAESCQVEPSTVLKLGAHTFWIQAKNVSATGPRSAGMNFTVVTPTPVGGQITSNTTWTVDKSPYVVTSDVLVYGSPTAPVTLTIEAGVEVRFDQYRSLTIGYSTYRGALRALGTAEAPIRFTSNEATKTRGYWGRIDFEAATEPTTLLDHVTIEYGGYGTYGSLYVGGGSPTVRNTTLQESSSYGVYVNGTLLTLEGTTVRKSTGTGIYVSSGALSLKDLVLAPTEAAFSLSMPASTDVTSLGTHSVDKPIELRAGNIGKDITWHNFGAPYVCYADVYVYKDATSPATLTIEAGVEVQFGQYRTLTIGYSSSYRGALRALGTAEAPIRFTSNQATKTRGYWGRIDFEAATEPTTFLDHVTIEYGGYGNYGSLYVGGGSPTVRNTTIQESSSYGVSVYGTLLTLEGTTVRKSTGTGIYVSSGALSVKDLVLAPTEAAYSLSMPASTDVTSSGTHSVDKPIELRAGNIEKDITWHNFGAPYVCSADVYVYKNATSPATLTIEAGVEVQFGQYRTLTIGYSSSYRGALRALGTAEAPIRFTSNQVTKTRGFWGRIDFEAATEPTTFLDHVTIEYGGYGSYGSLYVGGGSPTLRNTTIQESSTYGIYVNGTNTLLTIEGTTVRKNTGTGILVSSGALSVKNLVLAPTEAAYSISMPAGTDVTSSGTHSVDKPIELRGGYVAADITWHNLGAPYVCPGEIYVYKDSTAPATLTIAAGVEVQFGQSRSLTIGYSAYYRGALRAVGTADAPVRFTSNQATKTRGYWGRIDLESATEPTTLLDHVTIEYGGSGNYGALYVGGGSPTVRNTTIQESNSYGIYVYGTLLTLDRTTVRKSTGTGIYVSTGALSLKDVVLASTEATYSLSMPPGTDVTSSGTHSLDKPIELRAGYVTKDITWHNLGVPYVCSGDVYVYKDSTAPAVLTIEPGLEIRFEQYRSLSVGYSVYQGGLRALGTPDSPILFTSNQAVKTPGYWDGLYFSSGNPSNAVLQNVVVEFGGSSLANIYISSSSPVIRQSVVRNSSKYGIYVSSSGFPSLKGNNFAATPTYAVYNGTYNLVDARASWWNHPSGPSKTGSGEGEPVSADVLFAPWLEAPQNPRYFVSQAQITKTAFNKKEDGTNLAVTLSAPGTWVLEVLDSSNKVVKTYRGSGASVSQSWSGEQDGTNDKVQDGAYTLRLTATAAGSGEVMAPLVARVTVVGADTTLPVAILRSPSPEAVSPGGSALPVTGTAKDGNDFLSYRVEYGLGTAPSGWTVISTPADVPSPVENGQLATWSTTSLNYSTYSLRLTVKDRSNHQATAVALVQLLTIVSLGASEPVISPNGDSRRDTTTISASVTLPVNWTVTIKNASGVTVRTFTGVGMFPLAVWDGKNEAGTVVPEGAYTYVLEAVHAGSGVAAMPKSGSVTVDLTGPTARITSPIANQVVFETVLIEGEAHEPSGIAFYRLDYGAGATPTNWYMVHYSSTPVTGGKLAEWVTNTYTDTIPLSGTGAGTYTIRLTVEDRVGNVSTDAVRVNVDNLYITSVERTTPTIRPLQGETTAVSFTLNQGSSSVKLRWVPELSALKDYPDQTAEGDAVRTIDLGARDAGTHSATWDGRNDQGKVIPREAYIYVIEGRTSSGRFDKFNQHVSYPVTSIFPGEVVFPANSVDYNPFKNEFISHTFQVNSGPGRTSFCVEWVNSKNQTFSLLPQFHLLLTKGPNTVFWDGRDEAGNIVTDIKSIKYWITEFKSASSPCNGSLNNVGIKSNYVVVEGVAPNVSGATVKADPYLISLSYGQVSAIKYTLDSDAEVTVTVRDPETNTQVTLLNGQSQTAGDHEVVWDGQNASRKLFSSEGSYTFSVVARYPGVGSITVRRGSIQVVR